MRKALIGCLCLCLMMGLCAVAGAAGVTIRTFTPFADMDFASQGYMDAVTAWEEETGNVVEDYSGLTDEAWETQMRQMIAAGEADILIVPAGMALSSADVITVDELLAAAPDCGARRMPALAGADGTVLMTPVRLNWEALYVNTDVLAAHGLSVPATYDELITVCAVLAQMGVVPVANALCEWPEIVLDCAALAGAPAQQYGTAASLTGAQEMLMSLTMVGAFGPDAWNMTDGDAEEMFLSGQAAMRFDADWLCQLVPADRQEHVAVINVPGRDGQVRTAIAGTPAFGLAITRSCWEDDARCEAALSLVEKLLSPAGMQMMTGGTDSAMGQSVALLTMNAGDCAGLLYDVLGDGYDAWAEGTVSALMGL